MNYSQWKKPGKRTTYCVGYFFCLWKACCQGNLQLHGVRSGGGGRGWRKRGTWELWWDIDMFCLFFKKVKLNLHLSKLIGLCTLNDWHLCIQTIYTLVSLTWLSRMNQVIKEIKEAICMHGQDVFSSSHFPLEFFFPSHWLTLSISSVAPLLLPCYSL